VKVTDIEFDDGVVITLTGEGQAEQALLQTIACNAGTAEEVEYGIVKLRFDVSNG
jgi:hypothetical protein